MHRTQILLDDWQYQQLQRLAVMEKKSLSQLIREWIGDKLGHLFQDKKEPLHQAAGMLRGHVKEGVDLSKLDDLIYKKDW